MKLDTRTIYQIIKAVDQGAPASKVATQFNVDRSTVRYHVERFETAYGSTSAVYSLIPSAKKKVCDHPSLQCLVCGQAQDELRRRERYEMNNLKQRLAAANQLIESLGYQAR